MKTQIKCRNNSAPKQRRFSASAIGAFALCMACVLPAQAQDFKGLFQQLIKPGQSLPSLPQAPASITNVLNGGSGGSSVNAGDVAQLLTKSVEQIDEPKEMEIGRTLAAVLLGSKPLHPDMALQRYVNRLGRWIALQSDRPDLKWTFGVLDDPGYNAFAAPGGYIVVTKGLIDRVADESELAGILAHEITHVTSKHHLKAMNKNAQTSLGTQLLAQAAASKINNSIGKNLSSQVVALGRDLYSRGLDQGDELEADRNGVALATRAGFDPFGLVAVLQQLRSAAPDNPIFSLSMSTHPAPQLRLDQLEQVMGKQLDAFVGKPSVTLAQRLGKR